MKDRILIVDDNRAIHEDYRKILEVKEKESAFEALESLMLGEAASAKNCTLGIQGTNCQRYRVSSAYQGEEGLRLVKESLEQNDPFEMVFVDMRMPPGWDGLETIEHIWQIDPELQVVICTAYSDHSWDEITRRFPNEHRLLLLKKPFDVVEVCQLASALTQKWHSEQTTRKTLQNLEETVDSRTAEMRHELEERRRMEAALRESESEFSAIFETASDGIVIIDEDGTISRCNSAVLRMIGRGAEQLIGANIAIFLKESSLTTQEENFLQLLGNATESSAQEFELLVDDGQGMPVSISTSEFCVANQRRYTVTLRDITEQKQLERDLFSAQKLESIGQLAAGIAHEINTPMQCVSGNVEFLRNCYERLFEVLDQYREYLEGPETSWEVRKETMDRMKQECRYDHIRREAPPAIEEAAEAVQKVIEIVRAMKAMSHPGTLEKVQIDVNELIRSATTISRNRWKYAGELVLELDASIPDILALPAELNQVMLNLIVNAADAVLDKVDQDGNQHGMITIRTCKDKAGVRIEVEDTGIGIPDEIKQRIFDPFFTTKEVGKGTGQGLAISYDVVVNKHGGRIFAEPAPGKGTTFTVWLPVDATCPSNSKTIEKPVETAELAETH